MLLQCVFGREDVATVCAEESGGFGPIMFHLHVLLQLEVIGEHFVTYGADGRIGQHQDPLSQGLGVHTQLLSGLLETNALTFLHSFHLEFIAILFLLGSEVELHVLR